MGQQGSVRRGARGARFSFFFRLGACMSAWGADVSSAGVLGALGKTFASATSSDASGASPFVKIASSAPLLGGSEAWNRLSECFHSAVEATAPMTQHCIGARSANVVRLAHADPLGLSTMAGHTYVGQSSKISGAVTLVQSGVSKAFLAATHAVVGTQVWPVLSSCALAGGAVCLLQQCGVYEEDGEDMEGDENKKKLGLMRFIPHSITFTAVTDSFMAGVVLNSWGLPLHVPLRAWILGGIVLSVPTTWLVHKYSRMKKSTRAGIVMELLALAGSFAWLAWGTVLLTHSPEATATEVPLLFWSSFVQCMFAWSCVSTGIFFMIITTVVSILIGTKN